MFWLRNYIVRVLAAVSQVSLPTLEFCFCLLIPLPDLSPCFLLTHLNCGEVWAQQEGMDFFLWCSVSPGRNRAIQRPCAWSGRREIRKSVVRQENGRMLSGTMQLVFFFPLFLTSVAAEEGTQLAGRLRGGGRSWGWGVHWWGRSCTRHCFLPHRRGDAVSSAADLSFLLCFPFPLGTTVLELL